jgi:hypothetical protein
MILNRPISVLSFLYLRINNYTKELFIPKDYEITEFDSLFLKTKNKDSYGPYIFEGNSLQIRNSFTPLFYLKTESVEAITPDFSLLIPYCKGSEIDEQGIREFILFNTPLEGRSFIKDVKRITGISKIELLEKGNSIQFTPFIAKDNFSSINDIVQTKVEELVKKNEVIHHAILLSGGNESRINAAISAYYKFNTTFVTWGHPKDKEFAIAASIAKKLKIRHINVRPNVLNLPYQEYIEKTGFLSNMQYAYRYQVIKEIREKIDPNLIWTGWGDINGYPSLNETSELFSTYFLSNMWKKRVPRLSGWNNRWLFLDDISPLPFSKNCQDQKAEIMKINREILTPLIFGQSISAENSLIPIFPVWHDPDIFHLFSELEIKHPRLVNHKGTRVRLKGELYYYLLNQYYPALNWIINAKGFYPGLFNPVLGPFGPLIAAGMRKLKPKEILPFDPIEDKKYLVQQLNIICENPNDIFDRQTILELIKNYESWDGNVIMEVYKLIQVSLFMNYFK